MAKGTETGAQGVVERPPQGGALVLVELDAVQCLGHKGKPVCSEVMHLVSFLARL